MATIWSTGLDELQFLIWVTTKEPIPDSSMANLVREAMPTRFGTSRPKRGFQQAKWKLKLPHNDLKIAWAAECLWTIEIYARQAELQRKPQETFAEASEIWRSVLPSMDEVRESQPFTSSIAIYVDFSNAQVGLSTASRFSTRRKPRVEPGMSISFGKDLVLYDKTAEVAKRPRKAYVLDIRRQQGWSPEEHGRLLRAELGWRGKRLLASPFPDLTSMLHAGLDEFPLLRAGYRGGKRRLDALWRQLRSDAQIQGPWGSQPPPGFVRAETPRQRLRRIIGTFRSAAAELGASAVPAPQEPEALLQWIAHTYFAQGGPDEIELMNQARRIRVARGSAAATNDGEDASAQDRPGP